MSQYTSEQSRRPGTSGTTYLTGTDVIHYNQLLEGYLNCKQFKPLLTVSNVGDGSLLLKMDVEPFPALTSLVAEQDLRRLMEKVSSSVYGNTSTMATMSSSGDAPDDQTLQVITSPPTTPTRGYLRNTRTPPRTRTPTLEYLKGFSSARSSVGAESGTSASRHSLRVRFQRTDLGYEYKVVTAIEEHFCDDTEDNVKSSSRRARNKKSRRHSNERPSRGEIAVMIDESDLLTNPKSVSPSLLSRLNTLCEAPNKDTSNPEESVSVDFNLVKPVTNADVTCTWPSNMENNSTLHGDATIDSNQTMVAYHTWKKKQRRGDPVKSISYVVCKSISASGYFLPANLSVAKGIPATFKVDKQGNTLEFLARRRSYSYPPSCRFSPYPTPVRPAKWPSCEIGGKPSYRYSTENDILAPSSVVKVSTPIKTRDERDDQMVTVADSDVAAECIMEIPTDAVTVGQNATYSQTEPSNASPSTTEVIINGEQVLKKNSPLATRTRREIRSRKLRPRAGRRTGERVTSNDQVFSGEQSSVKMCKMEINDHLQIGDDSVLRPKLNATERRKSRMPETVGDQAEAKTRTPYIKTEIHMSEDCNAEMSDDKVFQQNNHHSSDLNSRNTPGHEDPNSHCDATPKTNGSSSLLIVPQDEVLFKRRQCTVKIEQDDDCLEEEGGNSSEGSVRSESETSRLSHENRGGSSPKKTLRYRYKVWSDAYMKMRTSPFLDSPISGQLPQFVRYPPRNPQNVEVVIRSDKAFAKLSGRVEVPITLPVKKPNARNWKEVLVGDLVWCKWRSKEYWPATVYEIGDTTPLMVTVLWTNDTTQSTVDYSHVDTFDLAFHLRFDSRRSDQKYLKAVATALRYAGKMGFWEKFLTKKLYDEIVKQTSPAFCRHIGEKEIAELSKRPAKAQKQTKESRKEDKACRERGEELLQALQASHFISVYDDSPLVANALPLTQRVVDDYLGSAHYASRNSEPLFEEGKIPLFEPKPQYEIDPHILGSNEIYHPDENGFIRHGLRAREAIGNGVLDRSKKRRKKKVLSAVLDEKPPTPEPFSEIDALRRLPYRITSKKRPVANLEIKQAKVRRFN